MNEKVKIPTYRVKLVRDRSTLTCREPVQAADVLRRLSLDSARETMHVLYVDAQSNIVGAEMVSMGGVSASVVTAREVLRGAIVAGAYGIVLGHNHPSESCSPSQADINMTHAIERACEAVGVPLFDHIITTEHYGHFSMLEHGLLLNGDSADKHEDS